VCASLSALNRRMYVQPMSNSNQRRLRRGFAGSKW